MNTVARSRTRMPLPAAAGLGIAAGLIAVSFGHILTFAQGAGARLWEAIIIATTVDGLIIMSLATIAHARRHGVTPPPIAKAALLVGVVATGGANLHHGLAYGWQGVAVAIWVPLVAEVAYLLAMSALRITQTATAAAEQRPVVCGRSVSVEAVMARVRADGAAEVAVAEDAPAAAVPGVVAARPVICGRAVPVAAVVAGVRRRPAAPRPAAPQRSGQDAAEVPDELAAEAAAAHDALPADVAERVSALPGLDPRDRAVAALVAADRVTTGGEVADLSGCSERTGRRIVRRVEAALELAGIRPATAPAERPVAGHGDRPAAPVAGHLDALVAAAT